MKKRIVCVIMAVCLVICSSCGAINHTEVRKRQLYEEAVAALEQMEPDENGIYAVTEELVVALSNAAYTEPKNIIFMIGDGMGYNIIEAAEKVYSDELYEGTLAMKYMPVKGTQSTYSTSSEITDSAAAATALSTGYKTKNKTIALSVDGQDTYKTTLELAAENGKSTGVVATKAVTDATPAAFTAHVESRTLQEEIANMQLEKLMNESLDLLLGGGYQYYETEANAALLKSTVDAGLTYTKDWDEVIDAELPVLGLFAKISMDTTDIQLPTLAEMTTYALEKLSEDEDGFFLMVEGSQIDTFGEKNEFDRQVEELYDFDCAVAVAMRYVALHPDTVLIITADHETGGVTLPIGLTLENTSEICYATKKHTCKAVPVFAAGYGTDALTGIQENTDIAIFVAGLLGEDEFGVQSTTHTLIDTGKNADVKMLQKANPTADESEFLSKGKDTVVIAFDEKDTEFALPLEGLSEVAKDEERLKTIHMTVTNQTDQVMQLPEMKYVFLGQENTVKPQKEYIEPGETLVLSYVFPTECWRVNFFEKLTDVVFTVNGAEAELEISDICITTRIASK